MTITAREAEAPLVLSLDIGSSSARAVLFDGSGRAVKDMVAQVRYALHSAADGTSEISADALLEHTAQCIDHLLTAAGSRSRSIASVAVTTLATTLMGVDRSGRVLTPLYTYADTRNAADAEALRTELDEREVHERTGAMLRASYWAPLLAWLRRVQPDLWRNVVRWMTFGEYLELRLFGSARVTFSAASWSGLLDRRRLEWDQPLLDHLTIQADRRYR